MVRSILVLNLSEESPDGQLEPTPTRGSVKLELNRGYRETRQPHLCRNRNDPSTDTRITTPHTLLSVATIEPTPQRANSVGDQ